MKKTILFLVLYLAPCLCWGQEVQVYFSPNGGCQHAVIAEIRKATQTIDIAMYFLSSYQIARALVKAQENNVRVRIVLDQGQEIESASKSGYLVRHGFKVRYHMGFGLMHNKFAVIDDRTVITGSFNWTLSAEERNEENLLVINDPKIAEEYEGRFDYLWDTSRPDTRNDRGLDAVPGWFCTTFHAFCPK
ncbi:MAG: phospholipase D family protein [Candidatus Omnitrophica bacterium]|nr:phospholipase D family protein [Candidatus Omnitrophota bacterium]MDE2010147.1 phospholipase D family protein [Candidatus Omnitrophota bacterium]MDE2214880.1 phospholipase D family protein [Candidatus Omnitrophota bacterium]MDE2230789.1 phospholipase D family protein [Candidatus Omnitrophota bacterium]